MWLKDGDCDPGWLIEHLRRRVRGHGQRRIKRKIKRASRVVYLGQKAEVSRRLNLDRWDYGSGQSDAAFFGIESDR